MKDMDTLEHSKKGSPPPQLLIWGCSDFGQNGHGRKENVSFEDSSLDFIDGLKVKFMDCGSSHTVIVTDDDKIYSWGNNSSGQLGIGSTQSSFRPVQVHLQIDDPIAGLSCGYRHTMIWCDSGRVYSFGNNFFAQLGYDFEDERYKENQLYPHLMTFMSHQTVKQVSCGDKHSLFLLDNGSVTVLGSNTNGQLGTGDNLEAVVPRLLDLQDNVKSISSGANHNLAITESGSVLMWGYCKALGRKYDILTPEVADIPYPVIQVAGGSSHSMALTENGHIYVWGSGIDGQLGKSKKLVIDAPKRLKDPNLFGNTVVIACGESFNAALTQCGQLYMWGKNNDTINATKKTSHKQFEPVLMNGDYKDISLIKCGGWHAMALTGRPETTIIENTDSLTDESTSETESIEAVELKPEITDMNLKTKEDENGNTLLVSPPPVSHLHSNAKKKYSRQTIGEFYESKEPPGDTCLNVDESTKICNPGKIQNKCHEATSQLTSLPTEATTSEVIPADSKVLVSPNNNKAGSVHYLIEFHGNSLIKSDNSANQNSHTNKHGKCKPAFFLLSQKTNNSVDCADQKELNEPQNRNSELSEKIITNSKNNTNSKISLDFKVKSKDSLYKERVFVSQRDMKLKAVDDLKLKTLFDDLFEHGSSDKLSEDKKQRLKVLYEAIVPGSRHLSSLSDAESKPPARRFGLSNNHHKPPSVPRDRTYLKYNTGKKIREVGDKAKQQKIGTQPSNQKPIFSSASSWKKRPLLRGQTYCESSPSHMNSKQLVRNTKQRSTSASSQQCHEPKLLLRRKLSS